MEEIVKAFDELTAPAIEYSSGEQQTRLQDLNSSLPRYISVDKHIEAISTELRDKYSESDLNHLIDWYESDLGRRITALEVDSSTEEAFMEIESSVATLLQDQETLDFVTWFYERHDLVNHMQKLTHTSTYAAYQAAVLSASPENRVEFPDFSEFESDMGAAMNEYLERTILASGVYTYQSLDDNELNQYKMFLQSKITTRFTENALDITFTLINDQIMSLIKDMPEIMHVES